MRHRADDNNVPWMDKLVEDEIKGVDKKASVGEEFVATVLGDRNPFGSSVLDRIAADDAAAAAPMSMDEIEKKIDSATSVEELDALEDQLKNMNDGGGDTGVADTSSAPDASASDASAPAADSDSGDAPAPAADGSVPAAPPAGGDDIASLKGDIGKIKETLDDKQHETNQELLQEIKKLNEAMGADKTVDLNNTIDQSS